jgi:hypothetical protein
VQLFRKKALILLKDKCNFKFLIIGERRRTTANGGEPFRTVANALEGPRTNICRSFFEVTNGQNSISIGSIYKPEDYKKKLNGLIDEFSEKISESLRYGLISFSNIQDIISI